ncbi:MAG: hypothetical protein ABWY06_08885 [Pseudomonas sp.]|uniref:hypothetical protein n=1 Tax=Pseudomonas sp. TaxID=306 RepID=UPI0033944793
MKQSNGFDARRLRSRGPAKWRWRCGKALALLLGLFGIALAIAAFAALAGHPLAPELAKGGVGITVLQLLLALVALIASLSVWRRCRRRLQPSNDLSLAPHLLKK